MMGFRLPKESDFLSRILRTGGRCPWCALQGLSWERDCILPRPLQIIAKGLSLAEGANLCSWDNSGSQHSWEQPSHREWGFANYSGFLQLEWDDLENMPTTQSARGPAAHSGNLHFKAHDMILVCFLFLTFALTYKRFLRVPPTQTACPYFLVPGYLLGEPSLRYKSNYY